MKIEDAKKKFCPIYSDRMKSECRCKADNCMMWSPWNTKEPNGEGDCTIKFQWVNVQGEINVHH